MVGERVPVAPWVACFSESLDASLALVAWVLGTCVAVAAVFGALTLAVFAFGCLRAVWRDLRDQP